MKTIAHVSEPIDRAILDDLEGLTDFFDSTLRLGVLLAEENQVLNGDGVGQNFTGILNTAGIGSASRSSSAPSSTCRRSG